MARSLPLLSAKKRKVNEIMKIDMSFWSVFFLIGTDLVRRAIVQGVEPALVSTVVEYGSAGLNRLSKRLAIEIRSKSN